MNYWEHPAVGWGSYAYYHPMYGVQSAQFDTMHYRWSMMPDTLNYLTDPDSALAVAELMYHVGVAVGMNYGTSEYAIVKNLKTKKKLTKNYAMCCFPHLQKADNTNA